MKNIFLFLLCITTFIACRGKDCGSPNIDIRYEVDMKQAYTNRTIIGRIAQIKTKDNLAVCGASSIDNAIFSNYDGIAKGHFFVAENDCDRACSPFSYFFAAQPDSLVCVNNYQKLDKTDNKFTLLFKPYILLELHLRSSFDSVEIMNVQLIPEAEALRSTVSIFHNKNFGFNLHRVDTTIFSKVLPEEPVKIILTGRTTTVYFRQTFTILPENNAFVRKTIDF
jgi:hypothetical protein